MKFGGADIFQWIFFGASGSPANSRQKELSKEVILMISQRIPGRNLIFLLLLVSGSLSCSFMNDVMLQADLAPLRDSSIKVGLLTNKSFPPTSDLKVFADVEDVTQEFVEIADLHIDVAIDSKLLVADLGGGGAGEAEISSDQAASVVRSKLRDKAMQLGADALVLKMWRGYHKTVAVPSYSPTYGIIDSYYNRIHRVEVLATAVRFRVSLAEPLNN